MPEVVNWKRSFLHDCNTLACLKNVDLLLDSGLSSVGSFSVLVKCHCYYLIIFLLASFPEHWFFYVESFYYN